MPAENTQVQEGSRSQKNPDIELFLSTVGELEIEFNFGLNQLNTYLSDLMLLERGVPFPELGISKRREANRPKFGTLSQQQGGTYSFTGWRALYFDQEIPENSIALLQLNGVMRSTSSISSPGVDILIEDLRNAYNHPNVAGVIIETNSGGGESLSGSMLRSAIEERNKPVVGFGHLVASAAYRALAGSDEIIASGQGSEFGSIGTMISVDNELVNEYRSRFADFYGSDAPGKNYEFRQALAGNFRPIQERVDTLTEKFQAEIAKARPLSGGAKEKRETLSGSVFDALESKRRGLVDGLGTMQYAVKRVRALARKY